MKFNFFAGKGIARSFAKAAWRLAAAAFIGVCAALAAEAFLAAAKQIALLAKTAAGAGWLAAVCAPAVAGLAVAGMARLLPPGGFLGLAEMALLAQQGVVFRLRHHLLSSAAAAVALGGGASVGQYGPIAHLGGAVAAALRAGMPRGVACACGIAAAIAAVFHAPIAGLVFAHEVALRHFSLSAFAPVATASVCAYSLATGVLELPPFIVPQAVEAALHPGGVVLFVVLGALFGAAARAFLGGIFGVAAAFANAPLWARLPLAGAAAGALGLWLPGIGGDEQAAVLQTALAGNMPPAAAAGALAAKAIATVLCLGLGFAGGVVGPILLMGALAGVCFAAAVAPLAALVPAVMPPAMWALAGMAALTAPALGAPLACILLVMELGGSYPVAIAATVAVAVSAHTAARLGGKSYYEAQMQARMGKTWAGGGRRLRQKPRKRRRQHKRQCPSALLAARFRQKNAAPPTAPAELPTAPASLHMPGLPA